MRAGQAVGLAVATLRARQAPHLPLAPTHCDRYTNIYVGGPSVDEDMVQVGAAAWCGGRGGGQAGREGGREAGTGRGRGARGGRQMGRAGSGRQVVGRALGAWMSGPGVTGRRTACMPAAELRSME